MTNRPAAGSAAANQFGVFQVHYASEPQMRFIRTLVAERDTTSGIVPDVMAEALRNVETNTINKRYASDFITWLKGRPFRPRPAGAALRRPASDKQVGYARSLVANRDWEVGSGASRFGALVKAIEAGEPVESQTASAFIDWVRECPRVVTTRKATTETPGAAVTQDGMYRTADGTIYKVQVAVHGSGNLYAKRLVLDPSGGDARFEYEPGAITRLRPSDRMTLEQAKEFGRLYGVCCKCGATLTDEVSIEAGIGPVCGSRGW